MSKRSNARREVDRPVNAMPARTTLPVVTSQAVLLGMLLDYLSLAEPTLPVRAGYVGELNAFRDAVRAGDPFESAPLHWREAYAMIDWACWEDPKTLRVGKSFLTLLMNIGEGMTGSALMGFDGVSGRVTIEPSRLIDMCLLTESSLLQLLRVRRGAGARVITTTGKGELRFNAVVSVRFSDATLIEDSLFDLSQSDD